jgi:cytochrome c oxidase subunit 2
MRVGGAILALAAAVSAAASGAPFANAAQPVDWGIGLQEAATPVMERIASFNDLVFIVALLITIFVLLLLVYVVYRFSAKRHPVPSTTTHHTMLEVAWTVVPIIILVVIAIPSFRLLYFTDRTEDAEMTIKAIGHQWYWSYEYPDFDDLSLDAFMIQDREELADDEPWLLATDTRVVLPVETNIRVLVTADDVIHSWAMPAFGVKIDAVPGRVNETWVRANREGLYFGQCSELCGVDHAFMPITVEVISKEAFATWIETEQAARGQDATMRVALAARERKPSAVEKGQMQ